MMNLSNYFHAMKKHNLNHAVAQTLNMKHARDRYYAVYEQKYFQCKTDAQRLHLRELNVAHFANALNAHDIDQAVEALKAFNPLSQ